jgi:hypothetical protein
LKEGAASNLAYFLLPCWITYLRVIKMLYQSVCNFLRYYCYGENLPGASPKISHFVGSKYKCEIFLLT